jgi:hypothetical protein
MAMSRNERLRAGLGSAEQWLRERNADLAHGVTDLEVRGRKIVGDAWRNGENVVARTSAELRDLARKKAEWPTRAPVKTATVSRGPARLIEPSKPAAQVRNKARAAHSDWREEVRAGTSGAVDEFTFGVADHILAGGDALLHGGLEGAKSRYDANIAAKHAEDAYDAEHYGLSRNVGKAAGLGASLLVMGAPGLSKAAYSLLPKGAKIAAGMARSRHGLDPRGLNTMAAAGGAGAGLIWQGASDLATGHRSSLQDYLGAGVGGAADGLATLRLGPVRGGAVGGAATVASQDGLNGRPISVGGVMDGARNAAALSGVGGTAGTYAVGRMSNKAKGNVGEAFSLAKTIARGKVPFKLQSEVEIGGGRHSVADIEFGPKGASSIVEAKMGPYADLTTNQRIARRQARADGREYIVDGWQFSDAGKALASTMAGLGVPRRRDDANSRSSRRTSW